MAKGSDAQEGLLKATKVGLMLNLAEMGDVAAAHTLNMRIAQAALDAVDVSEGTRDGEELPLEEQELRLKIAERKMRIRSRAIDLATQSRSLKVRDGEIIDEESERRRRALERG